MIEIHLKKALASFEQQTGQKMTYEDLAQKTGLSRSTLESLGSRGSYNTTLQTIDRVCEALNCDLSDLLYFQSTKSEPREDQ